jgi:hypothetical protein
MVCANKCVLWQVYAGVCVCVCVCVMVLAGAWWLVGAD